MAIAYRTIVVNETPGDTTIDPAASANDVIICALIADGITTATRSWPASFDELATISMSVWDSGFGAVARKKAASGSEGTLTAKYTGGHNTIGAMISFSGVDNTTPEDVAVVTAVLGAGDATPWNVDSPTITPSTAGAKLVAIMFSDPDTSGAVTHSFSTVSGSTGSWTTHDASIQNGTGLFCIGIGSCDWTSGDVVVRGTATGTGSADCGIVVIALRPAGGGSSSTVTPNPASMSV